VSGTVTGYLTCFKGRLQPSSTLVVDGAEYPVPAKTADGSTQNGDRVREAIRTAGYALPSDSLNDAIGDLDDAGGYEITLVKA
jgi:hypothetical protein